MRCDWAGHQAGPGGERDAAWWLASQDRGWRDGDRFSFAVLAADDADGCVLAGNVGLKNREETGRIGERETAEIGYWTAVAARPRHSSGGGQGGDRLGLRCVRRGEPAADHARA